MTIAVVMIVMEGKSLNTLERSLLDSSPLAQQLDPRGKIVVAVFFSMLVAMVHSIAAAAFALAAALVLTLCLGLPLVLVAGRLLRANFFIMFLWFFLPLSGQGEILARLGPLAVHYDGLRLAGLVTLKSNAILLVFVSLIATSPFFVLGHALGALGMPRKLVQLLLFTYRYLHVMEQEYRRLRDAMAVRAFRPRTNMHTYRTYGYFLGMLLVRSFARAERVQQAMQCRGFNGRFHSLRNFRYSLADGLLVLAFAVISIGVVSI